MIPKLSLLPHWAGKEAMGCVESDKEGDQKKKSCSRRQDGTPIINQKQIENWSLPKEKRFMEFFTNNSHEGHENMCSWPRFQGKAFCIRFHTTGRCQSNCPHCHITGDEIQANDKDKFDSIDAKFSKIYS